jgi:hypothetical protein
VNLTPFAGLLSDGQPHTVSLSVYNANNYFSATASVLLYTDPGSTQVTGAVTNNTLAPPSPVVTENINVQPTFIQGTVDVTSKRSFAISGYVNTSHGKVSTTVAQTANFSSDQYFDITGTKYVQNISQGTTLTSSTTVQQTGAASVVTHQNYTFPLVVNISELTQSDGDTAQITKIKQTYQATTSTAQSGNVTYSSSLLNTAQHGDTLLFDSSFNLLGNTDQSSSQDYTSSDSTGASYSCDISAAANRLTAFSAGCSQF